MCVCVYIYLYICNGGQIGAVQVNLTPLISSDTLATDASELVRPPPIQEIVGYIHTHTHTHTHIHIHIYIYIYIYNK